MNKFIVGLILGIGIAGLIAYYFNKNPNQFVNKAANESGGIVTSSSPVILSPGTKINDITTSTATTHRSGSGVTKSPADNSDNNASAPSYDFYDILQGKKAADNSDKEPAINKKVRYYIQVGAFKEQNLANDMKARLALMGVDSKIKSGQEDSKIINRVVIGPFSNEEDTKDIVARLEAENIQTTLIQIKK